MFAGYGPDLAVLDGNLSGMDGIDVCRMQTAGGGLRDWPVPGISRRFRWKAYGNPGG